MVSDETETITPATDDELAQLAEDARTEGEAFEDAPAGLTWDEIPEGVTWETWKP